MGKKIIIALLFFGLLVVVPFILWEWKHRPQTHELPSIEGKVVFASNGEAVKNARVKLRIEQRYERNHSIKNILLHEYEAISDHEGKFSIPEWRGKTREDYHVTGYYPHIVVRDRYFVGSLENVYFGSEWGSSEFPGARMKRQPHGKFKIKWVQRRPCKYADLNTIVICIWKNELLKKEYLTSQVTRTP